MINFPKCTEYNKRIPKQKFYENSNIPPSVKNAIKDQIKTIYWRNKLTSAFLNVSKGHLVEEIEVFEINLNEPQINEDVLLQIDKAVPYHILFLLEFEGEYQAYMAYKEIIRSDFKEINVKLGNYYHTYRMEESELPLKIEGLSIDEIYENFIRQIAGSEIPQKRDNETFKESVERGIAKQELQRKITALEKKMRNEKQFNKQIELNIKLKELRQQIEEI